MSTRRRAKISATFSHHKGIASWLNIQARRMDEMITKMSWCPTNSPNTYHNKYMENSLVDIHVDTGRKLKVLSNCKHSNFNVNFIGCDLRHCCRCSKVHPSQVLKITFELTCTHTCRHGRKLGLIIHQSNAPLFCSVVKNFRRTSKLMLSIVYSLRITEIITLLILPSRISKHATLIQ